MISINFDDNSVSTSSNINDEVSTQTDFPPESNEDISESDEEFDNQAQGSRKRKRIQWQLEKQFDSQNQFEQEIAGKWVKWKQYPGDNKKWYKCALSSSCPVRMHMIFYPDKILMMVNGGNKKIKYNLK